MRRLAWSIAGTMFAVAVGAAVARNTVEIWPLVAVAVLLGYVGWAAEAPAVRRRFAFLNTPAMRFNAVYLECSRIRAEIQNLTKAGEAVTRGEYEERVTRWETSFWEMIGEQFLARQQSLKVSQPKLTTYLDPTWDDARWAREIVAFLLTRRNTLDKLAPDVAQ